MLCLNDINDRFLKSHWWMSVCRDLSTRCFVSRRARRGASVYNTRLDGNLERTTLSNRLAQVEKLQDEVFQTICKQHYLKIMRL